MKRHDTDVTSLVFGLLFLGIVVVWMLLEYGDLGPDGVEVAVPALFVTVGLAGLAASISKLRRGRDRDADAG
ncbi:hypothetical protein [Phytoactinopolyspora endophytica]|uniref:hypothetical protein n=1 Tax=Phytoactinopolyspora endophytica TaxID=1642495 RepID=UPI00101BD476|nr:hypothetical protein [Phytoactinopolyspora endophytica]